MDLLKTRKSRTLLSEIIYISLNLGLVVALVAAVQIDGTPWLAFALVLLSKWRVFAVRPRYWAANIRANAIDTIVGLSVVVFLSELSGSLPLQIGLAIGYAVWLLYIKPKSKRSFISTQALIGVVMGISALMQYSPEMPAFIAVILAWVIGHTSARHIMSREHEAHINFLSLLWGFVIAEIMWLTYHWTIGYEVVAGLQLAQATIIVSAVSLVAERVYSSFLRHGDVQIGDVILPALLTVSVIAVMLIQFNDAIAI